MRRLPTATEVRQAALARLAGWSPEEFQAGTAAAAHLVAAGIRIDAQHRDVAAVLARLRRPEDRATTWAPAAWSRLTALLVLLAESRGDATLFWQAGMEVLRVVEQARRGGRTRRPDALNELIDAYLRRHPDATAAMVFDYCRWLASASSAPIVDADADTIDYVPDPLADRMRSISRHAFEERVSRIRRAIATPNGSQKSQEPVPVSRAA